MSRTKIRKGTKTQQGTAVIGSEELLNVLKALVPGLASKEILEQSKCFLFTGNGFVCTYNDRIMVTHPLPFELEQTGAVSSEELLRLLSSMPEQELSLDFSDSHMTLIGRRSRTKIPLQPEITLPVNEIELPEDFKAIPSGLIEAMKFCLFSCAKDMTHPVLTCVSIKGNQVVSCDNLRATRVVLDKPVKGELLLPFYVVKELVNYTVQGIALAEDWVHFKCSNEVVFSCRKVDGKYPDVTELFSQEKSRTFTLPEKELTNSLARARIFSQAEVSRDEFISLELKDGFVLVSGQSDRGEHKERLKLTKPPKHPVSFNIHPVFLEAILERSGYTLSEDGSKLYVKGNGFEHVALLFADRAEDTDGQED